MAAAAITAWLCIPSAAGAQTQASPFTSGTRYDLMHRVTGTIAADPDGSGSLHHAATRIKYDAAGNVVRVEKGELAGWVAETVKPEDWSSYTTFTVFQQVDTVYDVMDRKVRETVSSGGTPYAVNQYSYDVMGRVECVAVRMNPAAWGSLPASACTLGAQGGDGPDRITRTTYTATGQVAKIQKAYGTALQQDYATYEYSANDKQTAMTDANGNRATMSYDGVDRLAQWTLPAPGAYEAYGYDANSNRTSLTKQDGRVLTYQYDALNRLVTKVVPDGCAPFQSSGCAPSWATRDVYYSYDLRGLQTAARYDSASGGDAVLSDYDGFGRLVSSTTSMSGSSRTLGYQYDADGARVRTTWPDGQFVDYNRDGLDRLYYADLNGATPLFYPPYDAQGRVATLYRWVNGGWRAQTSYGYDAASRLASLGHVISGGSVTTSFAYNPAGQVTAKTRDNNAYAFPGYVAVNRGYAVNGLNQYTSAGPATFGYDGNQNLVSDGTSGYGYDAENRLVTASNGTTLAYDPSGRLWQVAGASGTTQLLYDGDQLSQEYDGAGNVLRRYVHGEGEDDPLVWYEGAGTGSPRYLYADHQGSVVAVADAGGALLRINAYDEYGIPAAGNTVPSAGRFQYTGQAWLPELGLYHYKARIYSPTLGRFLQTDPIGYADQNNLYAYVGNDPVNNEDPSGECTGSLFQGARGGCTTGNGVGPSEASLQAAAHPSSGDAAKGNLLMPQGNGSPRGGDTGPLRQAETDDQQYLSGNMSEAQLQERRQVRSDGALTGSMAVEGAAVVRGGVALARAGAAGVRGGLAATKNFLGPRGPVIGRARLGGSSILGINSNNVLRFGWGWKGGAQTGSHVLRISGDWVRAAGVKSGHIDLLSLPSWIFP